MFFKNCTNHNFCKTTQNFTVQQQNTWQIVLRYCIYILFFLMQCLSISKLAEILMCFWNRVLCLMIGMCLFASREASTDLFSSKVTCNSSYHFSRMCLIVRSCPPVFPVRSSCHQRKNCKDNVALLQWQTKEPLGCSVKLSILSKKKSSFYSWRGVLTDIAEVNLQRYWYQIKKSYCWQNKSSSFVISSAKVLRALRQKYLSLHWNLLQDPMGSAGNSPVPLSALQQHSKI